jgi:predicted Na+-dependent transporter
MNQLKRWSGLVWMGMCPLVIYLLASTALSEIEKNPVTDTRIQWGVFIIVFIPISLGLFLFGWFAWKGEYDHLPESSGELEVD